MSYRPVYPQVVFLLEQTRPSPIWLSQVLCPVNLSAAFETQFLLGSPTTQFSLGCASVPIWLSQQFPELTIPCS